MIPRLVFGAAFLALVVEALAAADPPIRYPYGPYHEQRMDPEITGWPLTAAGRAWAIKPRDDRHPGAEAGHVRHELIPLVPAAGRWKDPEKWLTLHGQLVEDVRSQKKPVDVVLLGDSITYLWGGTKTGTPTFHPAWSKRFSHLNTVNLGIQGDTTETVLWRLDHGAIDGIEPRVVVLLIGVNNHPTAANQEAVGQGIQLIIDNIRARSPESHVIVVKTLPVANEDMRRFNDHLDTLRLDELPLVHVLDLWEEFVLPDGTIDRDQYIDGGLHLGEGYERYAARLEPLLQRILGIRAAITP